MSNGSSASSSSGSADSREKSTPSNLLKRADHTALYGPTTKDRVRLADTDLTIEIEADRLNSGGDSAADGPYPKGLGLDKKFVEITSTRGVTKADMKLNDTVPESLEVDHNSFEVTIGGATMGDARTELNGATVPRAYVTEVPMAQRYFLF